MRDSYPEILRLRTSDVQWLRVVTLATITPDRGSIAIGGNLLRLGRHLYFYVVAGVSKAMGLAIKINDMTYVRR